MDNDVMASFQINQSNSHTKNQMCQTMDIHSIFDNEILQKLDAPNDNAIQETDKSHKPEAKLFLGRMSHHNKASLHQSSLYKGGHSQCDYKNKYNHRNNMVSKQVSLSSSSLLLPNVKRTHDKHMNDNINHLKNLQPPKFKAKMIKIHDYTLRNAEARIDHYTHINLISSTKNLKNKLNYYLNNSSLPKVKQKVFKPSINSLKAFISLASSSTNNKKQAIAIVNKSTCSSFKFLQKGQ